MRQMVKILLTTDKFFDILGSTEISMESFAILIMQATGKSANQDQDDLEN